MPATVVKGEQIAVKIAMFNFWMQDLEVRIFEFDVLYIALETLLLCNAIYALLK